MTTLCIGLTFSESPCWVDDGHTEYQSWTTNKYLLLLAISCTPGLCCVWKETHSLAGFVLSLSLSAPPPSLLNLETISSPVWFSLNWIWNIHYFYERGLVNPERPYGFQHVSFWRDSDSAVGLPILASCFTHCHQQNCGHTIGDGLLCGQYKVWRNAKVHCPCVLMTSPDIQPSLFTSLTFKCSSFRFKFRLFCMRR